MQDVIEVVGESNLGVPAWPDFKFAMMQVAGGVDGGLSSERLARWLRDNQDRIVGGRVLRKTRRVRGHTFWKVEIV